MNVREILAPYHMGRRGVEVGAGPLRMAAARPDANLRAIELGAATTYEAVNAEVQRRVGAALSAGEFPLVLAGNCNSALGTDAALPPPAGVVWVDAHGDFNDESTTVSGLLEGMSLAQVAERYVPEERIVLAGFRDLDPGERVRLDRSRITLAPGAQLDRVDLPDGAVYVHVDLDVLDPTLSPGVNFQAPGGLTEEALTAALAIVFDRCGVRAAALTNHNPDHDPGGVTTAIAWRLIDRIRGWLGNKHLRAPAPSR